MIRTWWIVGALLAGCSDVRLAPSAVELDDDGARRVCGPTETVAGADVSSWQPGIDWARASRELDFAIARVSDGTRYPDREFDRNWEAMADEGLVRGAYQYFRAGQSATAQADLMIDAIGRLGPGDLPPVLDIETADGQSGSAVVAAIDTWLRRVESATGRVPVVYTMSGFWTTLPDTGRFARYPLWVANWGVTCPEVPAPWTGWVMWQTTDAGSVPGMPGNIDLDVFGGSYDELLAFAGEAGDPLDVAWTRAPGGEYTFTTRGGADLASVEVRVDGWLIGAADRGDGPDFPVRYTFTEASTARDLDVRGFDATGERVAHGVGLIDTVSGTAVFVREAGDAVYEIGLERAPAGVAAIEVWADGKWLLTDAVSHTTRSSRLAVRSAFTTLGPRSFEIRTFGADGKLRGTLRRSMVLE